MAPTPNIETSAVDRVRHELLTALYFGRLAPGDRAPSVRGLARRTGMNKKTVHRAYTVLAREGLVDLRPGSGTFVAEGSASIVEAPIHDLVAAANRCKATADTLGLPPEVLGTFLEIFLGGGLRGVPVTVIECNREQSGLIAAELQSTLGVRVRPVLLSDLLASRNGALAGSQGIVTTDCHFAEVSPRAVDLGLPAYRVALDPSFPRRIAEAALRSPVILVVRDRRFESVFFGLLERLSVSQECLRRIRIVDVAEARRAIIENGDGRAALCLSPLVEREVAGFVPRELRRLRIRWQIESASMQRLKAGLALDLALRRHEAARRARPA